MLYFRGKSTVFEIETQGLPMSHVRTQEALTRLLVARGDRQLKGRFGYGVGIREIKGRPSILNLQSINLSGGLGR